MADVEYTEKTLGGLSENTPQTIRLGDARLTPDVTGALYWADQKMLIVADLHFEKGSAYARRGLHLPPYDTSSTLSVLDILLQRYRPEKTVALGDSFHDQSAADRLGTGEIEKISALTSKTDWIWIAGNHDPAPPCEFGGNVCDQINIGSLTLRHAPGPKGVAGEIAGHLHPAARVVSRGRNMRRRCFVSGDDRLIMPALGAYAGGLNVLADPFRDLFEGRKFRAWMLGRDAVYPVAARRLLPD